MSSVKIPKLLKLKDYVTLIGTSAGILALICAVLGSRAILSLGFFLISISQGTDVIDGYIARKTNTINDLGRELDSLSDSLTFGIAPAILTFQAFKTETLFDLVLIIGSICFALGAILRLARFNLSEIKGYTGLPTPISALLLITFFYANYFYAFGMGGNSYPFLLISSYLAVFFMILIGWFNITSYIHFSERDRTIYIGFFILAPLSPLFGIIGLNNPNFTVSIIVSIFFLVSFITFLIFIIRGFFNKPEVEKKS